MKLTYNDKQHAYWLDGKRCKGVTSVASMPDNRFNIEQWRDRMIVTGMAMSAPLVHRAAAHFDERDKIQEIAEEAMEIAKANEASGRGTADHKITERVDLGLDIIHTPQADAVADAWTQALDYLDLKIVPEYVERIVVYPDQLIAGRFDRIARYKATGRPVMLDVKTGPNAVKYPHSTAIQLALYTNAPWLAGPLRPGKPGSGTEWTDQFERLPGDIHADHALVVLLPPEGQARCFRLNIEAGWEAARQICFPTIGWRKRDDLVEEITKLEWTPSQVVIDATTKAVLAPLTSSGVVNSRVVTTGWIPAKEALSDQVDWVRGRVQIIKDAGYGDQLAALWTRHPDVPTFPKGGPTTIEQIDAIAAMCDQIEADNGLPFGATNPDYQPQSKNQRKATA